MPLIRRSKHVFFFRNACPPKRHVYPRPCNSKLSATLRIQEEEKVAKKGWTRMERKENGKDWVKQNPTRPQSKLLMAKKRTKGGRRKNAEACLLSCLLLVGVVPDWRSGPRQRSAPTRSPLSPGPSNGGVPAIDRLGADDRG